VVPRLSDAALAAAQADPDAAGIVRRLDSHGLAVVPLVAGGRVFGALTLVTTHARGSHTADELAMALEVARRAGPVLDAARAAHRSRRLAESMQRSLLALPAGGPGLQIRTRYRPAQLDHEVGGDWYDHFDLSDGATVVTIGDVMGHDTAAIAAMAQLRTLMRAIAWAGRRSPAAVLTDTHDASAKLGPGTFATAITGELEPAAADGSVLFRWSCAGHPPPVVLTREGDVVYLHAEFIDVPLGVDWPVERHDQSVVLAPGSVLLFYSDGLVERRDRDIIVGLDQLAELLASLRHHDLDSMLDRILVELSPTGPHHDDVALLAVRTADPADDGDLLAERRVRQLPFEMTAPQLSRAQLASYTSTMPPEISADAAVLVSELVTNALRHGKPPITLDIEVIHGGIRVAVSDQGTTYPVLPSAHPLPGRTSGRGLLILEALSTSWGVDPAPIGKTVWFTVVADGPDE
jgi:serine phosphatase RsbU (regulator of sigma subunit)/anti-sigma regulatory factor (Ser/Thr protein kinase)